MTTSTSTIMTTSTSMIMTTGTGTGTGMSITMRTRCGDRTCRGAQEEFCTSMRRVGSLGT